MMNITRICDVLIINIHSIAYISIWRGKKIRRLIGTYEIEYEFRCVSFYAFYLFFVNPNDGI
jgi:hypothetical protein